MASRLICDGCSALLPEEAEPDDRGLVRKTVYCDECDPSVSEFLETRDALHTALAEEWTHRLASLKKEWRDAHPGGRLPDE